MSSCGKCGSAFQMPPGVGRVLRETQTSLECCRVDNCYYCGSCRTPCIGGSKVGKSRVIGTTFEITDWKHVAVCSWILKPLRCAKFSRRGCHRGFVLTCTPILRRIMDQSLSHVHKRRSSYIRLGSRYLPFKRMEHPSVLADSFTSQADL